MSKESVKKQGWSKDTLIYKQVERDIRNRIQQGEWPIGSMLPSRANLAKIYGVSMPTLEQAIGLLIDDGTLRAEPKRGTFVAQSNASVSLPAQQPAIVPPNNVFPSIAKLNTIPSLGIISQAPYVDLIAGFAQPLADLNPDQWTHFLMQSLYQNLAKVGGSVRLVQEIGTMDMDTTIREAITLMLDHGVDAIVICIFDSKNMSDTIRAIADLERVPIVLISWEEIVTPCSSICIDDVASGYRAALHLLRVGYSPLLFLHVEDRLWVNKRLEGARKAIQHLGLSEDQLLVYPYLKKAEQDDSQEQAYLAGRTLLDQGLLDLTGSGRPPGVIAQNDYAAAGFLRATQEAGKVVGKDFGLVSFDNCPLATDLGLTTIRPPLEELGEEAILLLSKWLHERKIQPRRILLSGRLIVRSSTSRSIRRESTSFTDA